MDAKDVNGLSGWELWPVAVIKKAPEMPGVYVFRLKETRGARILGESDVVYVGMALNLKQRLKQHSLVRDSHGWEQRIASEVGSLEVAWMQDPEPSTKESDILLRYSEDHIDLPPGNRQQPMKRVQDLLRRVAETPLTVTALEEMERIVLEKIKRATKQH